MKYLKNALVMILSISLSGLAGAAIPEFIKYQGLLTDSAGATIEGSQSMTFKLYDASVGGNQIWNETQSVNVSEGLFQVSLGVTNPRTQEVFDAAQVWLGISIGANPELSPRERIGAVPYALQAEVAQSVATPAGSGWILAGNLGDLDAGNGQIAGYPTTEYEYGIPYDGNIFRAKCVFVPGPGMLFHNIDPFIVGLTTSPTKFRYGGILYMKGSVSSDDDGATTTNRYAGLWILDYNSPDEYPIRVISSFGFSGSQVYVRKL